MESSIPGYSYTRKVSLAGCRRSSSNLFEQVSQPAVSAVREKRYLAEIEFAVSLETANRDPPGRDRCSSSRMKRSVDELDDRATFFHSLYDETNVNQSLEVF